MTHSYSEITGAAFVGPSGLADAAGGLMALIILPVLLISFWFGAPAIYRATRAKDVGDLCFAISMVSGAAGIFAFLLLAGGSTSMEVAPDVYLVPLVFVGGVSIATVALLLAMFFDFDGDQFGGDSFAE